MSIQFDFRIPVEQSAKDRIAKLKHESIEAEQYVCVQRARYLTEAYKEHQADPMIIRRAKALSNVLAKQDLFLEEGQLLAGSHAASLRAAPIYPEFSVKWLFDEIDELPVRPGDRFLVQPDDRTELLEIAEWWNTKTTEDRMLVTMTDRVKNAHAIGVTTATNILTCGDGHLTIDYEKMIHSGCRGIINEAKSHMEALDLKNHTNHHKRIFYEAVIIAYEGVIRYANRYAQLVAELARREMDPARKAELEALSGLCTRVPEHPARSYYEAVQSVWFAHLITHMENNGHSISLCRLDQYLYPFYKADLEKGTLTQSRAIELLCCLWIKMFGIVKIRPWIYTRTAAGCPTFQALTLGGEKPVDGSDAVNDLSMLCLESIAYTQLPTPNVSARISRMNGNAFLKRCIDVVRLGFGMPALISDDLMVPALVKRCGVSLEDARNFALLGCIEPIIPGKCGYRTAGASYTNFPKMLEVALNGGVDPRTGRMLLELPRTLAQCESYDQVEELFKKVVERTVEIRVECEHALDYATEELVPDAFCSGLVQDCLGRGKTPKQGGAVYDFITGPETGIVNTGNSLTVIKRLVFEDKVLTPAELAEWLKSDFTGVEGESIRKLLENKAPKFGNDDDYVDEITRWVYTTFIEEQDKYPTARKGRGPIGCRSIPCTVNAATNVPAGASVGATAEGRHAGMAFSEGCSPYHGTDRLGPTAVFNSMIKLPNDLITGGNLLNMRLTPTSLGTEERVEKLIGMLRSFLTSGGFHVQFNVTSTETLLDAQANPEQYMDLVVRVAGYSARFNDLERATQDDIIARTEHAL